MSSLDKRETAAESKFAKDEEQAFARNARVRKLLALWAAEQMHMDAEHAKDYATALLHDYFNMAAIIDKIYDDLVKAGLPLSKEQIFLERDRLEHTLPKPA